MSKTPEPRTLALKITRMGNSTGLALPKGALKRLKVQHGDTVYLTETADGFRITAHDPSFATQVTAARKIMKRRQTALRSLAK
jgi:putative addiction module antidote